MLAFQLLLSCVPTPFSFTGGRRGTRLSTQNAYVPFASGRAGRSPIRFATGRVDFRIVTGTACGTYKCSLVSFEINCLWDKHQIEPVSSQKSCPDALRSP
jgi:hypothetical protein